MRTSPAVSAAPRAGPSPGGRRRTTFPGQDPQDRTRTRGRPQRPATTLDRGSATPRERRRGERVACACTADHPYIKPSFDLEAEEVMLLQLDHLRRNNEPYVDHGIEVLYRFADIDPFESRCRYFGIRLDLGQFERFRRMLHTKQYRALLNHKSATSLSTLKLSEHRVKKRFFVEGFRTGESAVFEWTLSQKIGGLKDGYWYVESVISDAASFSPTKRKGSE